MTRAVGAAGLAASVLLVAGCAILTGAERPRFVYEVSTSAAGGSVLYSETAENEPIAREEDLSDTSWTLAPELNPVTTTPSVTVTPADGATARCRILRLDGGDVTVVADQATESGDEITCAAPQPEHEDPEH